MGKEEFTTVMHSELLGNKMPLSELKLLAVYGAMSRGLSKQTALAKYKIDEAYYDANIERALKG